MRVAVRPPNLDGVHISAVAQPDMKGSGPRILVSTSGVHFADPRAVLAASFESNSRTNGVCVR